METGLPASVLNQGERAAVFWGPKNFRSTLTLVGNKVASKNGFFML
jgi:hypothetical protein